MISTSLYIRANLLLYRYTGNDTYLEKAKINFDLIDKTAKMMDEETGLYYDGFHVNDEG